MDWFEEENVCQDVCGASCPARDESMCDEVSRRFVFTMYVCKILGPRRFGDIMGFFKFSL